MKNKELQESRIRGYFIQATKSIIKGEGVKNVSVRNIAREAGYSYTTMYNYFKDVNELIFLCVNDFQEEIIAFVDRQKDDKKEGKDKLKARVLAYTNYFINYPGIFELFYLEGVGDLGHRNATMNIIATSLDQVIEKEMKEVMNTGQLKNKNKSRILDQLRFTITGALLFYLNRRKEYSYMEFMDTLNEQLDQILI